MSDESVVSLSHRRKALRRKLRRLAGIVAYLAPAPADEGQPRGVVLPFRTRAEPLLGRVSRFEHLAAAARGEASGSSIWRPIASRLERRRGGMPSQSPRGVLSRLSIRLARPEEPAPESTYIRPVLTIIPGGRADRDRGVQPTR